MQTATTILTLLALSATALAAGPVAQNIAPLAMPITETPLAYVKRAQTPPTIDGKLDDACWKLPVEIGRLRDNFTGEPALEAGTIRVCYDKQAIYIAVDAVEGQIPHLAGKPHNGKEDVWSGDEMEFFIAPHGDGKTFYHFCVGAKFGQRYDARNDLGRSYHDRNWQSALQLDEKVGTWTTEISIPFSAFELDGPPDGSLWGFNVCRQNVHTVPPQEDFGRHGTDNSSELTQWSPTGASFHTLSKFGRIFFGTPEAFAERRERLNVELILDRYAYDRLDGTAVGLLSVNGGGRESTDLTAMLTLARGKTMAAVQPNIALETPHTSFHLPIADLEPGAYKLIATLIAGDAAPATATWDFTVTDNGLADGVTRTGRIKLALPPRDADKRGFAWPVRTGVPLAQGALDDPGNVRLLVNGEPVPCQTSVRARWGPGASIRWLGLSFVAHAPDATYELEHGGGVSPRPGTPVTAALRDGVAEVNTGPLQFTVNKAGLVSARINGKDVSKGTELTSPYVVDEAGKVFRAAWARDARVEIEESGPVHAVVRVTGWFTAEDGARLCTFATYYEAFAGLPHLFVDHTVVITYDTTQNKLCDIGFPIAVSGERYAFGVQDGEPLTGTRNQRACVVQDRFDHFASGGGITGEGVRLAGWADAGSDQAGVTVSTRYLWQRYPAEFSVDAQSLTYHLWPPDLGDTFTDEEELDRSNIYKVLSAHEGPAMDLQMQEPYYHRVAEHAKKEQFYLIYAKKGLESNGQGLAINDAFVVTFRDAAPTPEAAEAFTRLCEQDPHAMPDPKWTSLTQAMGPFAAADPENYPHIARFAGPSFLAMTWPVIEQAKDYGMFNFGDVHTYFTHNLKPPRVGLHRVWLNHHYSHCDAAWLLYAFYGDHKYLDWARVNGHHTMNVDIVHYEDPEKPLPFHRLGAQYHVKGFIHWGYDTQTAGHNCWPSYLNWSWFLTGNRRARDVGNEWVEGVVAAQPSGFTGREGQNALGHLANYYQHRFDPRLLRLMDRFATTMKSDPLHKQHANYWNPSAYTTYDMLRRDPAMIAELDRPEFRLERYADSQLHINAYLYLKTGDAKYLEPLRDLYDRLGKQLDEPGHLYHGHTKYYFLGTSYFAQQLMVIQKALEKAGLPVRPSPEIARPELAENGKYTRASPQQYQLGVMKAAGKAIAVDTDGDAGLAKAVAITGPDGKPVNAIGVDAAPGLYTIAVKAGKPVSVKGADPFFLVRKGQPLGLLNRTLATIAPLEGDGPITLTFRAGDKAPTRLAVLDADGNEVATASSWFRYELKDKTLTVPAGGPWRLIAPACATIWPDRDVRLVLHGRSQ